LTLNFGPPSLIRRKRQPIEAAAHEAAAPVARYRVRGYDNRVEGIRVFQYSLLGHRLDKIVLTSAGSVAARERDDINHYANPFFSM
jgi:hypothetical protein